jgi:hypothetical protein
MKSLQITHDADIVPRPKQIQQPQEAVVLTEPCSASLSDPTDATKHDFSGAMNLTAFMAYCI